MANEITASVSLSFLKGSLTNTFSAGTTHFTMNGNNYVRQSMSVPTSAGGAAIPLGSIATPGWFAILNTDGTNYVTILSAVSGTALLKVLPGEFCQGRFSVSAPAALANTSAVIIDYIIIDN